MRIEGSYRTGGPARAGGRSSAQGGGFSVGEAGVPRESAATGSVASSPAIDALIALQAVDDPLLARRKAVRRGRSLLDVLEEVRIDLLAGRVGEGRLNRLLALVTQVRERAGGDLDVLLDDIELRARVELAKHGHYPELQEESRASAPA